MALQNRVTPFGEIIADPARGAWMGNRGGAFHRADRTLAPRRRWASKAWIICRLAFRQRHRTVMGPGRYTELFFLDEATALAAGHRPCAECRRHDFVTFATLWLEAEAMRLGGPPEKPRARAAEIDGGLHRQRQASGGGAVDADEHGDLLVPGVFISDGPRAWLVCRDGAVREWSISGYGPPREIASLARPRLLTPIGTAKTVASGYKPQIDTSANP